jgi:hypothetical protein
MRCLLPKRDATQLYLHSKNPNGPRIRGFSGLLRRPWDGN